VVYLRQTKETEEELDDAIESQIEYLGKIAKEVRGVLRAIYGAIKDRDAQIAALTANRLTDAAAAEIVTLAIDLRNASGELDRMDDVDESLSMGTADERYATAEKRLYAAIDRLTSE
jgi:acyl-CoA reductase-like NAD-dependent aldehyde dehydrogenase